MTSPTPPTSPAAFKSGDIVRVRRPDQFIKVFAEKIKDRDAQVLWSGPLPDGQFKGRTKVRFLKRNGRGKEFEEVMATNDLVMKVA